MAIQRRLLALTDTVLEAIEYRRHVGRNDNPALGEAILIVDTYLLPWARRELARAPDGQPADAEDLLAEAGFKAIAQFDAFQGTTGAAFYKWVRSILAQRIAGLKRQRQALRNGGLGRVVSLERQAARLAELLISPLHSPEEAALIRESATRLHRALGMLTAEERRVVKLRLNGHPLRKIAARFGHAPSWAQHVWYRAVGRLRQKLQRDHAKTAVELLASH